VERASPEQIPQSQTRKRSISVFLLTIARSVLPQPFHSLPFQSVKRMYLPCPLSVFLRARKYLIHQTEKAILPCTICVTGKDPALCCRKKSDHAGIPPRGRHARRDRSTAGASAAHVTHGVTRSARTSHDRRCWRTTPRTDSRMPHATCQCHRDRQRCRATAGAPCVDLSSAKVRKS
jgi:hypothetical protein